MDLSMAATGGDRETTLDQNHSTRRADPGAGRRGGGKRKRGARQYGRFPLIASRSACAWTEAKRWASEEIDDDTWAAKGWPEETNYPKARRRQRSPEKGSKGCRRRGDQGKVKSWGSKWYVDMPCRMQFSLPSVGQYRWSIKGNGRQKRNGRQRRGNRKMKKDWQSRPGKDSQ